MNEWISSHSGSILKKKNSNRVTVKIHFHSNAKTVKEDIAIECDTFTRPFGSTFSVWQDWHFFEKYLNSTSAANERLFRQHMNPVRK